MAGVIMGLGRCFLTKGHVRLVPWLGKGLLRSSVVYAAPVDELSFCGGILASGCLRCWDLASRARLCAHFAVLLEKA